MASYHIRLYKDADYKIVRTLFENGIKEHIPTCQKYIWKLPRTSLFLLSVFLVLSVGYKYFYISPTEAALYLAGATSVVFALIWFGTYHIFDSYTQQQLKGDLFDIQHHYIQRKGACFWVVESNEEVVAMVAAEQHSDPDGGMKLELKRLSVNKAFRGHGIAKALCQTLIKFARQENYQSVILDTTMVQHAAQQLYKNLGFRQIRCFVPAFLIYRLVHFQILVYRYDIRAQH